MKSKKNMIYLVIMIALLITVVGAYTFAFVGSNKEIAGKLNTTVATESVNLDAGYSFKGTSGQIFLSVNNTSLSGSVGEIKNKEISITSSLLSKSTTKYKCTYDIYYVWEDETDAYTISGANEFTYALDGGAETNFVASSNKTPQKVNSSSLTINNNSVDTPTEIIHTITTKFYKISGDQSSNGGKVFNIKFYIDNVNCEEVQGTELAAFLQNKVASSDQVSAGSNGYLQKQTVSVTQNATLGINSSSYENIIYTGPNPNNFIEFNGEMWRIIGVYNEDSHGIANTRLVKIIRNDNLIVSSTDTSAATARWDYKNGSVGSGSTSYGSNEWSDSQLMFMLNGENALNKGKKYNGNTYTYANTAVSGNYIQTRTNTGTYYTIWNKANGSYLSYDGNGNAISNKTIYTSSQATTSSYSGSTAVIGKTISRDAQEYIQEVTWHLGGYNGYTNTATYYEYERNNYEYSHTQTSETRSSLWTGKIGLMYPSDYGYATSGGSLGRNACLTTYQVGYASSNSWYQKSECYTNDWLLYLSSTITKGSAMNQWTISPRSSNAYGVLYVYSYGYVTGVDARNGYGVRPVLYLKADAAITDEGDGSYTNPYKLA